MNRRLLIAALLLPPACLRCVLAAWLTYRRLMLPGLDANSPLSLYEMGILRVREAFVLPVGYALVAILVDRIVVSWKRAGRREPSARS